MHHSSVNLRFDEQVPEELSTFLTYRSEASSPTSDPTSTEWEPERPKKRRRVNRGDFKRVSLESDDNDEYLCLAKVHVSLSFKETPANSYPSPNSATSSKCAGGRHVLLKCFADQHNGTYQIRISAENGDNVVDTLAIPEPDIQALKVLEFAAQYLGRRLRKRVIQITCMLSEPQGNQYYVTSDTGPGPVFHMCVKVLAPNAKDLSDSVGILDDQIFGLCAPELMLGRIEPWSPRDFYDNVHIPQSSDSSHDTINLDQVQCKLYPFQKRAVRWLLQREGVGPTPDHDRAVDEFPHGFVRVIDADGKGCLLSPFLGIVTTREDLPFKLNTELKGGILAEEMGLGKTVEMIALLSLNRRHGSQQVTSKYQLLLSSATLIITPPTILHQWKNELTTLAPNLSVLIYSGLKVELGKSNHTELLSKCITHDVVLTTYNVLAKEIHYVENSSRDLRYEKKYEKSLSPLTQIEWWRVVLDEAQMVESGVSNAAKVAKLIPRELAWCVSGTPVKKDSRDLLGLLDFLHYQPYCDLQSRAWNRLITQYKEVFKQTFRTLALRHTKDQIKDELQLPPQKRVVITVPFTQIEEQHYSTLFREMSEDCGLDVDGAPLTDDWDSESAVVVDKMRIWLTRLRQTCLHPEVGAKNRRALGNGKGPLRTVGEVLEVMIDQNDTATHSEERSLLLSQIRRGQILEHAEMSEEALKIWLQTLEEVRLIVDDCRNQLRIEIEKIGLNEDLLMGEAAEAEGATAARVGTHRQRLRAAMEVEHMCTFFVANAYFQIKTDEVRTKPGSNEFQELERMEELTYERAKTLRKELLQDVRKKVELVMEKISNKARDQSFMALPRMPPVEEGHGIESRTPIDRLNDLIHSMQKQAKQLHEWREKTVELLILPLVDEEETDLQGDEYEMSTKQQDEVYVYVDALRALVADRHDILTGHHNLLIKNEMSFALKQAKEGQGHSPELLIKLLSIRSRLIPDKNLGSARGLITEIRELRTSLRSAAERGSTRAAAETVILNSVIEKLHEISVEQTKAVTGLEREIELFRDTMNLRLEYYRQLQQISDTVAPFEEDMDEQIRNATLRGMEATELHLKSRIASLKSKGRYLVHLRDEANATESQKICIICQQQFEVGLLTSCGHSYCADCFRLWWNTHRNCPTCKKHLHRNDFHQITYKPSELTVEEEAEPSAREMERGVTKDSRDSTIYSGIRDTILSQIKDIDLDGSFGTKIDTLGRHILWIREHDPGAKSIIFSQYKDFLDVLARAFGQFKIGFTGIDRKDGIQKFKDDPSRECFFLHAKAHSSGLNLVNATHVFLCEPLINTALELQAIARVHRIGQHQPTTVWMYLVENTVEKAIYDISVSRRLSHMGKAAVGTTPAGDKYLESEIDAANNLELEEAPLANLLSKGSAGGEMVATDDLWNCLFQQKAVQPERVPRDTERVVGRHLAATAAEARLRQG